MKVITIIVIAFTLTLFSCQNKSEQPIDEEAFIISKTWMRPGVINRNTAAFMKITNNTDLDDTLFAASSDLAKVVEIHETYSREDNMKGMRHVESIIIPSGSMIKLKPGSFHIMLIGLNNDLYKDDSVKLILRFKNAGDIEIDAKVK